MYLSYHSILVLFSSHLYYNKYADTFPYFRSEMLLFNVPHFLIQNARRDLMYYINIGL